MYVPPDDFGLVENGVYRCLKLELDHFPFLETLGLKTFLLLDAAKPPGTLREFIEAHGIELLSLGSLKISNHQHTATDAPIVPVKKSDNDSWMILERSLIEGAFQVVFDKTKHPMLLVDSSLTFVGILRKIQKWNFHLIINEYRIYTGNSAKNDYAVEIFLDLIQVELVAERARQGLVVSQRVSMDEEVDDEVFVEIDDTDYLDEEALSASPQIPPNLLKLAEKHNERPRTLHDLRRRLSIDARKLLRNRSFRDVGLPNRRPLFEVKDEGYRYYKPLVAGLEVIGLKLPPEPRLPEWFTRGRNFWEAATKDGKQLNETRLKC